MIRAPRPAPALRLHALDRRGTEGSQHAGADAGRRTDLEPFQVFEGFHLPAGKVQFGAVMHMRHEYLGALEFFERVLLHVFPEGAAAAFGGLGHERQLEHLGLEETSGLIRGNGPDDVRDAVLGLVEQLRRRAAQLHRRIDLAL